MSTTASTNLPREWRLHIGNISPKLASSYDTLNTRLSKFGTVIKPLEVHTKPLGDKFFGFITMQLTPVDYEKIRNAFHEVVFMGMKLSVNEAKPAFSWQKDHDRPDSKKADRVKRDRIQKARELRIQEASTAYPSNSITVATITGPVPIAANQSSSGYLKSSHTTNNKSGNTKNKPPSYTLKGLKSYSHDTVPKRNDLTGQQFSRLSGSGEIIKGRLRTTTRSNSALRAATLRILINGELKTYKNYKTKLWGMEKNKTVRDLTWKYADGVWKSGDDHIVETVDSAEKRRLRFNLSLDDSWSNAPPAARASCAIGAEEASNYGQDQAAAGGVAAEDVDPEFREDVDKNQKVLASLFSKYDFDKPLSLEDDDKIDESEITYDSKGRRKVKSYDYEIEGGDDDDRAEDVDSDSSFDYSTAQEKVQEFTKLHQRPDGEVYYGEDDEGNELDFDLIAQSTEGMQQKYDEDHYEEGVEDVDMEGANNEAEEEQEEEEEVEEEEVEEEEAQEDESEEEFIPTFGSNNKQTTNDTETLRTLFNKQEEETFKLTIDEDDIDHEKEEELNDPEYQQRLLREIELKQQNELQKYQEQRRSQFGLFWTHSDSPFLSTQSQLNKIGAADDNINLPGEEEGAIVSTQGEGDDEEENAFEKWFWAQRGELSRECKRRRRDVMRAFKKRVNL